MIFLPILASSDMLFDQQLIRESDYFTAVDILLNIDFQRAGRKALSSIHDQPLPQPY